MPHDAPILETNAGFGRIFERCYFDRLVGVALEKDLRKAEHLSNQRPTWRVYATDSAPALAAGLSADLPFGLIDIDPYGSPFDLLAAIFKPDRKLSPIVQLVVNDGLRNKACVTGGWDVKALHPIVERVGTSDVYDRYIDYARELVSLTVSRSGYSITQWTGWYAGEADRMTHYWATLERRST